MGMTLVIITLSLLCSAFFSGMEIAFVSVSRLKVELEKEQGSFNARLISNLVKRRKEFISAMLIGNNVALVIFSIYMGDYITSLILPPELPEIGALLIQTLISTLIILVTAEFLPKAFFSITPNRWLNLFAIPLSVFFYLLFPLAVFVSWLSRSIIKLFNSSENAIEEIAFGNIELDYYLSEFSIEEKQELDHEIQILQNALDFKDLKARDCQIPRNELVALEIEDSIENLRQNFIDTGFSKILIYRESIDNIIGYAHSAELFKKPETIKTILRPINIVPEPMPANEVLESLIKQKRNLAVVVDEFGGTSGLITIEDIVEELFGEIEDEHDPDESTETKINENKYKLSARLELDYLNHKYGLNLPEHDEYETLGGMILHHLEKIPEEKATFEIEEYKITVVSATETKIEEIELEIIT